MKVLVSGGSGFVGTSLVDSLLKQDHTVVVLSSSGKRSLSDNPHLHYIKADTAKEGAWQDQIKECDVIINLAGRSVFHLWSKAYKQQIYTSRINTTKNIVDALPEKSNAVLLSASAAGYYGDNGDQDQIESSPAGNDFLAEVCQNWEDQAFAARKKGVRVATMRFGVVLGSSGGAIATMKLPFLCGVGGPIGNGQQWFPWIHLNDLVGAILYIMADKKLDGAFNFTAPGSVRQKEFAKTLGEVLKRPAFFPAPAFFMRTFLGEFGSSLLQGQKVVPQALMDKGFVFRYPELKNALQEILSD